MLYPHWVAPAAGRHSRPFTPPHPPAPQILAKGLPDGAMAGVAGRQVTLDTKVTPSIPALLNSQGTKVSMQCVGTAPCTTSWNRLTLL